MGCSGSKDDRRVMDAHYRTDNETKSVRKLKAKQSVRIEKFYTLGRKIGAGGFAEVQEGTDIRTGKVYAVKVLSKLVYAAEKDREHMRTEVELMAKLVGHPNVVNLHETYEDKKNFYLVMEYCTGNELMAVIEKMRTFTEQDAARMFRQMCLGVQWCHQHRVVHRDLKPENFLFADAGEQAALKLADFGLATEIKEQDSIIHDACGSAYYIAPEVFTRRYTKAVDVWSLGIILYLLLSGTVPFGFHAEEEAAVYKEIQTKPMKMEGAEWSHTTAAARELISGLLEKDPAKRYTIEQALEHPWVTGEAGTAPISKSIIKSMQNFNRKNKFKKDALKLIASTLSAVEVQKLRQTFHEIDADHTGTISFVEMAQACKRMNLDVDLESMMRTMDEDGDGVINYDEFITATADRQLVHHQNNIWWAFCEYDTNGDGFITAEELRAALGEGDREQAAKYLAEFDRDNDGKIDYEEFMRMVLPKDLRIRIARY